MPVYEYVCLDCHSTFEALRSMREADLQQACVECGGAHVSRTLSVPFVARPTQHSETASSGCACGGACSCGAQHR